MQPIVLNTQELPIGDQQAIAAAVAAVAQATIVMQLDEEQMDSMWQTSVAGFLNSVADIAFAQGCMQGHVHRIKADHCEQVYKKTPHKGRYEVEVAIVWRKGGEAFTPWRRAKVLEAFL